MATTKKSTKSLSRAQLLRERKKDHEDIIAKAARITGLEKKIKDLELRCLKEVRLNKSLTEHINDITSDNFKLRKEVENLKTTVESILTYNFKYSHKRPVSDFSNAVDRAMAYQSISSEKYPCPSK